LAFTDELAKAAERIRESQLQHPFVRALVDDSLEPEQFKRWVVQHYLFLAEYARILASAVVKSDTRHGMALFTRALDFTLDEGMSLHCACAAQFEISQQELGEREMWPTTRAYTDFLVRTCTFGDIPELLAVTLPHSAAYVDLGLELASGGVRDMGSYAGWMGQYVSREFVEVADRFRAEFDARAVDAATAVKKRLKQSYMVSSRYEWQFWDMCWTGERWRP
jgi:thiaminase/transcriptional activator TenA